MDREIHRYYLHIYLPIYQFDRQVRFKGFHSSALVARCDRARSGAKISHEADKGNRRRCRGQGAVDRELWLELNPDYSSLSTASRQILFDLCHQFQRPCTLTLLSALVCSQALARTRQNSLCGSLSSMASVKPVIRRSHTKSKIGCKTCKSRHIKCDEFRPRWLVVVPFQ